MAISVALDIDPGIDDALALLLAFRSPEIRPVLVTTVAGNGPLEMTTRNALRVLDYLGAAHIPVAAGASKPLEKAFHGALGYHGPDALAGLPLPHGRTQVEPRGAEELLYDFAAAAPGERTIIATGPLTNIARAFQRHDDMPAMLKELIIMGGAFGLTKYGTGNQTPYAEFNIWQDPDAAFSVFRSGVPTTIVGLDITNDPSAALDASDLRLLHASGTREAALAADLLSYALRDHPDCAMHDPLAVAVALDRTLFQFTSGHVYVVTRDDEERGRTLLQTLELSAGASPAIQVASAVDGPRFKQLFLSRMREP
ncbi:MAG: nucleoside hydrolase [Dehalococcoidia bacterium]|nr:nucleoside hydrolase [Dehalococcoidia bacterium]